MGPATMDKEFEVAIKTHGSQQRESQEGGDSWLLSIAVRRGASMAHSTRIRMD